jgi:hypothetical protein
VGRRLTTHPHASAGAGADWAKEVLKPPRLATDLEQGLEGIPRAWISPLVKVRVFQVAVQRLLDDLKGALLLRIQGNPQETALVGVCKGVGPEEEAEVLFPVLHVLPLRLWLEPSQGPSPRPLAGHPAAKDLPDGRWGLLQHRPGPIQDPVHPPADQGEDVVVPVLPRPLFGCDCGGGIPVPQAAPALERLQRRQRLGGVGHPHSADKAQ